MYCYNITILEMGMNQSSLNASPNANYGEGKSIVPVVQNANSKAIKAADVSINVVKEESKPPVAPQNGAKAPTVTMSGGKKVVKKKAVAEKKKPADKKKKTSGKGSKLEQRTIDDLVKRAKDLKIKGRHDMKKGELVKAIRGKNKK